jgi:EmrB/QacA subfamily drug resistance transporter
MVIFTVASLVAGLATNSTLLIAARGLQGIGAAFTAPNALALIATTFPEGKPRNNALAVYGAMSGLGIVAGLLLGGVLTGMLGWRWVFFINVPIGIAVLLGSRMLVEAELHKGAVDYAGALTSVVGMAALVYAITRGGEHGWTDSITVIAFTSAAAFLALFVMLQSRRESPLVPLWLFADRNRAGSYLSMLLIAFGPMGAFYLLTLYMQHVLQYSPLNTGLAWLPFGVGIVVGAGLTTKIVSRVSPRAVAVLGMLIAASALFWLSSISRDTAYFFPILPAIFALAFGFAMGFVPLTLTAVQGVPAQETGIASALLNASQQIGVALGLAVLSSVSVVATARQQPDALGTLYKARNTAQADAVQHASDALISGYSVGLFVGALAIILAAAIAAILINHSKPQRGDAATARTNAGTQQG